ncbi:sodium-dependent transporter [Aliarcobacter lanthieri]|uniref:sodium-dependent transporter n=1 Tax=Aliarcobacter lanthieri TaxID=1355374 RepID=UPI00047AD696|nr:sodium-dependent transporter [Aliarcobacter lanthieri]
MHKNRFSRVGYILAIAGSAIGLGNIWKFPYITGENGGGVFVLVFLITVFTIGMSIFIGEIILGKIAKKDAVSTFEDLAPKGKKHWRYLGFSFLTGIFIMSFYPIVIAWIFHYIYVSISSLPSSLEASEKYFLDYMQTDLLSQILYLSLAFFLIAYTISKGIKKGIEKLNNILMPALFLIFLFMLIYSFTLDGFPKAVEFMFYPDFSKFSTSSIIIAVGHAFFCLSIGMNTILTYSASISDDTNIFKAALFVVIMDVITAIVAGLIIFSIIFTGDAEPGKGAGLVFITLPSIFYNIGTVGVFLAIFFFIALAFAAITSAVSMLEPTVMYLIERRGMKRKKATYLTASISYIFGILALLSLSDEFRQYLTFSSRNLFDWFDFLTSAILMPLGGIFISIYIGFITNKDEIKKVLVAAMGEFLYKVWLFIIKFIAPILIFILMLKEIGVLNF